MKRFEDLDERDILALAIATKDEDARVYHVFAEDLDERCAEVANQLRDMADGEDGTRRDLQELYRHRFGRTLTPICAEDVVGVPKRRAMWLTREQPLATIRRELIAREARSTKFFTQAQETSQDEATRDVLSNLAGAARRHAKQIERLSGENPNSAQRQSDHRKSRRQFVLQYVQPGLAGLMDGSVSTLGPLFAAAFASHNNWQTFVVGLAAALGAGISMGFAEALSDDGSVSGRGNPFLRGVVNGGMTAAGGLGHTLPYLVPNSWPHAFWIATGAAGLVVSVELWIIAWVRAHYMDTPLLKAIFQIVLGGVIVLATGILIGSA